MSKVNKDKFFKLCDDKANEMLEKYMPLYMFSKAERAKFKQVCLETSVRIYSAYKDGATDEELKSIMRKEHERDITKEVIDGLH